MKSNKNDRNDAEAICEAVGRPNMRFVPIKSAEQLAVQAVHRIRSRLVADRVRLVNQVRGLLGEHGIVVAKDIGNLRRALAGLVGDNEDRALNPMVRALTGELQEELIELDARIAGYDRKIREFYRNSEICQRLGKVEGIGPLTATALIAAVGDRSSFKNGRQFAAWLGLVPKQRSSGGRARLFGISKRGDRYLRTLLIHGARAALGRVREKQDPRSLWLGKMRQRRHPNIVAVALANKNARIADMIDMRMPLTQGHSRAVAELAEAAGRETGMPAADVRTLRWAGLVHDIGELVVPVATWMRDGPLSVRERDAARLHAYYGERALAAFGRQGEPMAALVLRHHERLDGSGYHRKVGGSDLSPAARILAAARLDRLDRRHSFPSC